MSPVVINPVDLFLLVVGLGAVNVLFCLALTDHLVKKWVRDSIEKSAFEADFLAATTIKCEVFFQENDGSVSTHSKITLTGREAKAQMVQGWLDSRELMMVPKSFDFQVKAPVKS
jgi:hypothetical protein